MKKSEKTASSKANRITRRAEELLRLKSQDLTSIVSNAETRRLIHELEMNQFELESQQLELETQNQELISSVEYLEVTAHKFSEFYIYAPTCFFTLSKEGDIIDLNISGAKIIGKERSELKGSRFGFFVSKDTLHAYNIFLESLYKIGVKATEDVTLAIEGKKPKNVHLTGILVENRENCLITVTDIAERKLISDTQNFLLKSGYPGTGEDFFESLAKYLANSLEMDYVCIDKLEGDKLSAQTVAIYNNGKFEANQSYTLKETPCGDVVGKTICYFPKDVRKLFPYDSALQDLKAESYAGTTLWGFDGKPIGLIAVIGKKQLENPDLVEAILKLVAIRASGELERKKAEESEHRQNLILDAINSVLDAALTSSTEEELGNTCLEIAQKITQSRFGFIGDINENGLEDIAISNPGWDACNITDEKGHRISDLSFKIHGIYGKVISDGKSLITNDPATHSDHIGLPAGHPPLSSFLGVPLIKRGKTTGIIALGNRPGGYSQTEQDIIQAIAPSIVDAFIQKRTDEALKGGEERMRIAVDAARLGTWDLDLTTGNAIHSLRHDQIFGYNELQPEWTFEMACRHMLPEYEPLFREAFANAEKTGVLDFEGKVTWPDGSIHWIAPHGVVHYDIEGRPLRAIGVVADITEPKKMEEALRDSEKRFRELVKYAPAAIYEIDFTTRKLTAVNDAMCLMSGYSREELLSLDVIDILDNESRIRFLSRVKNCFKGELPDENVEYKIKSKSGKIIDAVLNMKFNLDKNGIPVGAMVVGHDITERKKTQEALLKSEKRLKYHLENSPLAVLEFDKYFNIIQWSKEAEKIFGYKRDEVLGVNFSKLNFVYEEDLPGVEKTIELMTSGKELQVISSNRNYTKDREVIYCVWHNSVLLDENGKMSSILSLIEDVTILKKTELELIQNKERYEELVSNARSIISKMDLNGNLTFMNEYGLDFFGFNEEEIIGRSAMDTIIPNKESSGRNLEVMVETILLDPDKFSININENIKKNGEKVWIEWHNKTLYDDNGKKTGHIAIGVDITKRKQVEEDLIESESKLWSVLNATRESIYMFDRKGIIILSNSVGLERKNYITENELIGHHYSEFLTPSVAKYRQKMLDLVFNSGRPVEFEDLREERIYRHSYFPVYREEKVMYIVTYSADITEQKIAEEKLKESEERFRTIAESLPFQLSISRISDSTVRFTNDAYDKIFGLKRGELIGKTVKDLYYNPEDRKKIITKLRDKGYLDNIELKLKRPDGSPLWILTSFRTIIFEGEPSYINAFVDITESKKAKDELMRLNRTLNAHSKSSQSMMHSKNELEYINKVCKIIIEDCGHTMVWIGYAQNDRNKSVKPVAFYGLDKGYLDKMSITWDNSERGKGPTGTAIRTGIPSMCKNMQTDPAFEPWREDAIKRGYSSSLVLPLISEGKPFGAISIYSKEPDAFSDAEINLLSALANDLAYGISFLRLNESEKESVRIIKENDVKLKELIVTKDKFFNIVAHDLKNPFTSLLGSSELLYENISHMTPESIKRLALILNDSAKGGYSILQNLLDWSRSQTGQLKICPDKINLKTLIDENIDNLILAASNKEITLKSELEKDLFVYTDKNMVNTILRNLLSNAVKFTFKNGKVIFRVDCTPLEVTVSVKDTGIGISKEKIRKLFNLDNSISMPGTDKEQGTGLGLKLCKEFVEKLGGKIWVESAENKGSDFKFSIPVKEG